MFQTLLSKFQMSNAGISRAKTTGEHTFVSSWARSFQPQANRPMLATTDDLQRCLYKRDEVILVSKEDFRASLLHKKEVHSYCKSQFIWKMRKN